MIVSGAGNARETHGKQAEQKSIRLISEYTAYKGQKNMLDCRKKEELYLTLILRVEMKKIQRGKEKNASQHDGKCCPRICPAVVYANGNMQ